MFASGRGAVQSLRGCRVRSLQSARPSDQPHSEGTDKDTPEPQYDIHELGSYAGIGEEGAATCIMSEGILALSQVQELQW